MKLSKETVAVLKNFASLNPNIYFNEGGLIRTVSSSRNIMAQATVEDEFEKEFGIYELPKFLASVSLFENPELVFTEDNYLTIESGGSTRLRYVFAEPKVLVLPPPNFDDIVKNILGTTKIVTVDVSQSQLEGVIRGATTIGVGDISFIADGSELKIVARSVEEPDSSGEYSITIGESTEEFNVDLKLETLKMIPGDYTVRFSASKKTHWKNKVLPLEYWIAGSISSNV